MLIWIECGLVFIALFIAFFFPGLGSKWFLFVERNFSQVARTPRLAVVVVGLAALAARAAVLPILPAPAPHILDEFSHLLLADTLLHGRLANSTPSMWIHFETPYVLMHPTYASMYPPAQGLVLALGQIVAHQPFAGVWLSLGVMCAAICWMLQGWMPAEWALLGGLLAVMRLVVFSYWADSYLGGAVVAATGGALVLGALPRIMRFARAGDALLMALGLAILANSRPYEGFVFAVPCAVALLIWFSQKRGPAIGKSVRTVLFPLSLALIATALAIGYYSWRVTGSPLRMPYQVDRDTYHVAPYFLWQSPKPEPVYHHEALRDLYARDDLGMYFQTHSVPSLLGIWLVRSLSFWCFYLGPVLTLPLVMAIATTPYGLGWSRIDSQARFLFLASALFIAGIAAEVFFRSDYVSPATGLIYVIVLMSMRHVRQWQWHGRSTGLFLIRAVPAICVLMLLLRATGMPAFARPGELWTAYNAGPIVTDRARIEQQLERYPGRHLVIVHYQPASNSQIPWVYNAANIDASDIIWAWDMGMRANQELLNYYPDRHVWLLEPDDGKPAELSPYPTHLGDPN
jgi:hypothetical protein